MKPNQLATLVLRLLGIYCLIVLMPMAELLNNVIFFHARNRFQWFRYGHGHHNVFINRFLAYRRNFINCVFQAIG